jgi:hypothetical protein
VAVIEPILDALNQAQVRYVVVGGVATVLHGVARFTADLDLIVDLSPAEARKAIAALTALGLKPHAPVEPMSFADETVRCQWIDDKAMVVFSLADPANPFRVVDLFVSNPIPFDDLWERSKVVQLATVSARVASLDDLIDLKRQAGRPQDLADIEALELIRDERERGDE